MFDSFLKKHKDKAYLVFRIFVGLLFLEHGLQKLFGLMTQNPPAALFTQFWFAGIIETAGGIAITLGILTRLVAFITGSEMLVAYFKAHLPGGAIPIVNHGELALLYFACFVMLIFMGAGRFSLEYALRKKELF